MKIFNWFKKKQHLSENLELPVNLEFTKGQKVFCTITHEVRNSMVGCGIIVGYSHSAKSYWAFSDKPSNWFKVLINGEIIIYPCERLQDINKYINHSKWLQKLWNEHGHKTGDKGASFEAVGQFYSQLAQAEKFAL